MSGSAPSTALRVLQWNRPQQAPGPPRPALGRVDTLRPAESLPQRERQYIALWEELQYIAFSRVQELLTKEYHRYLKATVY